MSIDIECPNPECEHNFHDDPDFADARTDDFETECPKCKLRIAYDVEFDPVSMNIREYPKCDFRNHEYPEIGKDHVRYVSFRCIHCGDTLHKWKDEE